ncbi:MAG: hypothetical protein M1823_006160 [Watsoniomyces obsoletus]|nr:MAG: hypothetical protein M1823_006160 [Watsoniomyces obsoletus]
MGISGLLVLLKSIHRPCHLKKFAGHTIGVDAYGWLHRGAVACALDLALGKPTARFVHYAMNRVRMLQHYGVIPYLVFDGDYLPGKAGTEAERAQRREENRKLGLELLKKGKTAQAQLALQKAIDVTPEMARQLIEELKKAGVQYVVAPYEADAQLAYMERKGIISAIISEDSDLLVFGAKSLLTKLDQYGDCIEVNRADFTACRAISLVGWTDAEFRRMAILSGCDYLPSLNKMGLKTAYRLVRKYKSLDRIVRAIHLDGNFSVPEGYLESFRQAEFTFLYQRVFCPLQQKMVMHYDLDPDLTEDQLSFIGDMIAAEIAAGVARGDLHPVTKEPLQVITVPDEAVASRSRLSGGPRGATARPPADDLKGGVPISTYFQMTRRPLAELDPNSFVPTTSQRRVLEQNTNTSWPAQNAPARPTVNGTSNASAVASRDRPTRGLSSISSNVSGPSTRPSLVPRASKRPRLCVEADVAGGNVSAVPQGLEDAKSRFFSSAVASTSDQPHSRRARKAEFSIFSDSSLDAAMSAMPEPPIPMQLNNREGCGSSSQTDVNAEAFITTTTKASSSDVAANITSKTKSASGRAKKTTRPLLDASSPFTATQNALSSSRSSRQTISLHPQRMYSRAASSSDITQPVSMSSHALIASFASTIPTPTQPKRPSTPLQRIGLAALGRSHTTLGRLQSGHSAEASQLSSIDTLSSSASVSAQSVLATDDSQVSSITTISSATTVSLGSRPVFTPEDLPLAAVATYMRGSEDFLVPDSEEEDDVDEVVNDSHDDADRFWSATTVS